MSRAHGRRAIASIAVVCAAAAALLAPPAEVTRAAWNDREHAGAAITALRLQPPQVTSVTTCRRPNISGEVLAAQWRWPATSSPYPLAAGSAVWSVNGVTASPQPPTTGPTGGTYTTQFTSGLLQGLLGGLLGGSYSVQVRTSWTTAGGQVWTSASSSRIDVTVPPLTGSPTCTATNGT